MVERFFCPDKKYVYTVYANPPTQKSEDTTSELVTVVGCSTFGLAFYCGGVCVWWRQAHSFLPLTLLSRYQTRSCSERLFQQHWSPQAFLPRILVRSCTGQPGWYTPPRWCCVVVPRTSCDCFCFLKFPLTGCTSLGIFNVLGLRIDNFSRLCDAPTSSLGFSFLR